MAVRIITDTSCDLPPHLDQELQALGAKTVPFLFHFGLETLPDKSMPMHEFLARADKQWPTTAAPPTGALVEACRDWVEAGDEVLCITITGKHSTTFASAMVASQHFAPGQMVVVDSDYLSVAQGILVLMVARAASQGATMRELQQLVADLKSRLHIFIALDTVDYLVRGGRASRLSGALASLLRFRPVLTMRDGQLVMLTKPRGRRSAMQELVKLASGCFPAEMVAVGHIACPDDGLALLADLAAQTGYPAQEILFAETGMVIATHGGPGVLGIAVLSRAG